VARRILLAWELGGGLGHLSCMRAVAERLRAHGAEVALAAYRPAEVREHLREVHWRVLQAPVPTPSPGNTAPPNSYADILLRAGFGDVEELHRLTRRWRLLFAQERIDALVLDYAPIAQLAGWLSDLPMTAYGPAFSLPPLPLPSIRPWVEGLDDALAASEERLRQQINHVATHHKRSPIETLAPWLHAPRRFMNGIEETNPFGHRPEGGYLGPMGAAGSTRVDWPTAPGPRVLVYLRPSQAIEALLSILSAKGLCTLAAIPGCTGEFANKHSTPALRIERQPFDLRQAMQQADAVINHGSAGAVCEALLAGKPQLMIPLDPEKALLTRKVAALGAGSGLMPASLPQHAAEALERLLDPRGGAIGRARAIAQRYATVDWASMLDKLCAAAVGTL
jgi:UDP:flavonoid glycosyltransferase YjiC (YdhE family)